jgi:hypothetical protein
MKDIGELQRAFNPGASLDVDEKKVCDQRVPTTEELWETVKSSPETAWAAARDAVPTLEEVGDYNFPDLDWGAAWGSSVDGANALWEATKDGAGSLADETKALGTTIFDKVRRPGSQEEVE